MARPYYRAEQKETGMNMNMNIRKIILIILLAIPVLFCGAQDLSSDSADALFRRALSGNSSFDGAIEKWAQDLRDSSVPGASLYYNMGNALALEGRQDEALAFYSRALSLKPGNRDFRYNRNLIMEDRELTTPSWSAAEGILWFPLWLVGFRGLWMIIGAAALAALIYTGITFFRGRIPSLTAVLVSVLFLLYGAVVLGSWEIRSASLGVIRGEELDLYEGDSPLYPSVGRLKGGEEVRILDERDGWYHIRSTAGSGEGWCEDFSVLTVEEVLDSY